VGKYLELIEEQKNFLEGKPEARYRLAIAGRQGGKTECGNIYLVRQLLRSKNKVFMIVAPTYTMLEQATLLKFYEVLRRVDPNWIVSTEKRIAKKMIDKNGNVIFFRSADRPDTLRGPTLTGGFLFDEAAMVHTTEPWRILYGAVSATKGFGVVTTTPKGANWIVRELIKPWERGDKNYHYVKWRSVDNPAFDKQQYEDAKKYQDPRWVAQEYDADFADLGGLVFPEFDDQIHCQRIEYNENLPVYWGVDFGINNPTYIGFFQVYPEEGDEGKIVQIDELMIRNMTFPDVLSVAMEKPYRLPEYACCDPSGKYREKITGIGTIDVFADVNIPVMFQKDWNTAKLRIEGINIAHKLLKTNMLVHHPDNCYNIIQGYGLYSRKPQREGMRAEELPIKDGVSDHCMESMFYFLLGKPYYDNTINQEIMSDKRRYLDVPASSEFTGF